MTAQMMERIYIDGKPHNMAAEPLEQYLESLENPPIFVSPHTACWRGYFGNWKIANNKLYLTGLTGWIQTSEEESKPIDLIDLFPNKKKVFADWFSGEIRVPVGRMIQYVHMGYESTYESNLLFEIRDGLVVSKISISNV